MKEHFGTREEDPLAGDVDKFVHPDETRTDEQIKFDSRYAVEDYDDEDWLDEENAAGSKDDSDLGDLDEARAGEDRQNWLDGDELDPEEPEDKHDDRPDDKK